MISHVCSHKVLTDCDLKILYKSKSLSKDTALRYTTRMVLSLALVFGVRPSSLSQLLMTQLECHELDGEDSWVLSQTLDSKNGASNREKGGISSVQEKLMHVPVWLKVVFGGIACMLRNTRNNIRLYASRNLETNRFYLQISRNVKRNWAIDAER